MMHRKQIPPYGKVLVSMLFSFVCDQTIWGDLSYPEESGVVAPVPSCGVQHVWRQNVGDDANDVAKVKRLVIRSLGTCIAKNKLTRDFVPAQPS
jgi:hypothetical protein